MSVKLLRQFIQLESASGILLFVMALLAIIWANSPLAYLHQTFIDASLFFINEGLMAIFFLLVGLELKRGLLEGEFADRQQLLLPLFGAIGGMIMPALIYAYINHDNPLTLRGWTTPVATDIAFALGVLSLFGKRVPSALKLFLLALAIFDDIGAIVIIVLFYSSGLAYLWLLQSILIVAALYALHFFRVQRLIPYLFMGILLWVALFHAGIHPTIAGVILALAIPSQRVQGEALTEQVEQALHPWVAFFIMPIFALANAGFIIPPLSLAILRDEIVCGIVLGLLIGKQLGVFGLSWLLIRFKWAKLPAETSQLALYGVALLCGIGFTMSLFLGTLSFENENIYLAKVRLGVIIGSILSGLIGALVLSFAFAHKRSSVVD